MEIEELLQVHISKTPKFKTYRLKNAGLYEAHPKNLSPV
ncbi:hypothetical protein ADU37_CDS01240 [Thermococcus sp. 2319x1]|nr:hypothetical protein ADU37_CDS01240 [Thermococcus sp. 2319x1]